MNEGIDRHIDHVRELTQRYGPLDIDSPTASINNPEWFADGRPLSSRQRLHDELVGALLGPADREVGRHAIVLAGAPGAGKSHLRGNELAGEVAGHALLDVDDVKEALLEQAQEAPSAYDSFLKPQEVKRYEAEGERFFPLELSALVHREAAMITVDARRTALSEGLPVVVDGVLSSEEEALALGGQLERAGYSIDVVCLDVTPEVSEKQIRQRWREAYEKTLHGGNDLKGGRWVPSSFAQHVLNGPGGRPRPLISSERLAQDVGAVSRYRVFSRESVDAPTVLTTDLARIRAGGPLIERSAAQAHRTALGRPAARPSQNRPRGQGYER